MQLGIQPLDTLFFRDGKPFARGDETWADSTFPPSPSVLYGALRTALATLPGMEIPFSQVADKLGADRLAITGLYYRIAGKNYLPLPLDLVSYLQNTNISQKKDKTQEVDLLEISANKSISNKSIVDYLLHAKDNEIAENLTGGLLNSNNLWDYLDGKHKFNAINIYDFVQSEPKVGIGRDKQTKTASDGLLYRVDMKRIHNIQIRLSVSTDYTEEKIAQTILQLGGETKLIKLSIADKRSWLYIEPPVLDKGCFKIYLSTPSIFTRLGWQPDLQRFGISAKLVAASVGKPMHIGGFDILQNRPKPMLKAVPAGSVYYYRTEEKPEKIIDKLHAKSLSDYLPEQGYGIAFIGNTKLP